MTETDALRDPVRFIDQRTAAAPFIKKVLRYPFPDHWSFLLGEVALYSFIVLIATGIYLALFYDDSTAKTIYHGPYLPLDGQSMSAAYKSVLDISFVYKAGPADPPDPPLGGGRVRGLDRDAPVPGLLHRRLPQAARADLDRRADHAVHGASRGLPRLLAGRRSALRDGTGDRLRGGAVDPGDRRPARAADLGRTVPGKARSSSAACTSRTCSCCRS